MVILLKKNLITSIVIVLIVIAVIAVIALFLAYTHNGNQNMAYTINGFDSNNISTYPEGFGARYYSVENSSDLLPVVSYVKDGNFSGYFNFFNGMYSNSTYLIFALDDYNLTPILFDGDTDYTHVINTTPRSFYNTIFNIPITGEGRHDIVFMIIQNPFDHALDNDSRENTLFSIASARFNVVFGNDTKPSIDYAEAPTIDAQYNLSGVVVNKEPYSNYRWYKDNVSRNETLNYYINEWNNYKADNLTFAAIQLLDYKQIPISNRTTYYGTISKGKVMAISSSIAIPDDDQIHELMVISIDNPYEYNSSIQGFVPKISPRVGLNIVK
jgi:hypothetical protein